MRHDEDIEGVDERRENRKKEREPTEFGEKR